MTQRIILLLLCLTCIATTSIDANAQGKYVVNVETTLNVRSSPSSNGFVIGQLKNGASIEVHELRVDGWAKINYRGTDGYVSSQFIRPYSDSPAKNNSGSGWDMDSLFPGNGDYTFLAYVIGVLSLLLFIISRFRGSDDVLSGGLYVFNLILLLLLAGVEIFYVASHRGDVTWFCSPDTVGWLWTVINFILFALVVFNQIICFFNAMTDIQVNSNAYFGMRWGIWSWIGCGVAAIACAIFYEEGVRFAGWALVACQIIQVLIILVQVIRQGSIGNAILAAATYLLVSVATVAITIHFLVLLIIVMIGYVVLWFIGQSGERGYCSSCNHLNGSYCSISGDYISNPSRTYCDNHN